MEKLAGLWFLVAALVSVGAGRNMDTALLDDVFVPPKQDIDLTVPELLTKYGYAYEEYRVQTEDGYLLSLVRMPPKSRTRSKPVLLAHGVLANAADFLISGPSRSLAYQLVDHGYEVWLVNMRGNRYSRNHTHLSPDSKEFWTFSWHEMGYYDLPAFIDFILQYSGAEKLFYIGHSQGALVYYVTTSTRPEYNAKIALMHGLGPAGRHKRTPSPLLQLVIKYDTEIKHFCLNRNFYELLPSNGFFSDIAKLFCPISNPQNLCIKFSYLLDGIHPETLDLRSFYHRMGHWPDGFSLDQMLHFSQLARSGRFLQYDYGKQKNLQVYGSSRPPAYNISASVAPVMIYYGLNDKLIHPKDVIEFSRQLPNLVSLQAVEDPLFTHLDFLVAKNVRKRVYNKVIATLDEYDRK